MIVNLKIPPSSLFEEKPKVPDFYKCTQCGAHGVKLWREYQTFLDHQTFLCVNCIGEDKFDTDIPGHICSVGWRVVAVPTPDGETYWGYTSIPQDGCRWWDILPGSPSNIDVTVYSINEHLEKLRALTFECESNRWWCTNLIKKSYADESLRLGNVEIFRRPSGCYRIKGRTFRTKQLALNWMRRNQEISVLWN